MTASENPEEGEEQTELEHVEGEVVGDDNNAETNNSR